MRPIYLPVKRGSDVVYQENGNTTPEEQKAISNGSPQENYSVIVSNLISKFETNLTPSSKKSSLVKSKSFSVRGSKKEPKTTQTQDDVLHNKTEAELEEMRNLGVRDLRRKFEGIRKNTDTSSVKSEEQFSPLENIARKRLEHFKRLTKKWERDVADLLRYLTETADFDIYNVRLQDLEFAITRELYGMKVKSEDVGPLEDTIPQKQVTPEIGPLSLVAKITSIYEIKSKENTEPRTPIQSPKRLPWTTGKTPIKVTEKKEAEKELQSEEPIPVERQQEEIVTDEPKTEEKVEPSGLVDTEHLKSASLITSYFNSLSNVNHRNNETARLNNQEETPTPPPEKQDTNDDKQNFETSPVSHQNVETPPPEEEIHFDVEKEETAPALNSQDEDTTIPPEELNNFEDQQQIEHVNNQSDNTLSPATEEPDNFEDQEENQQTTEESIDEPNKSTLSDSYELDNEPKEESYEQINESSNRNDSSIDREFDAYCKEDLKAAGSEERLFEDYYRENCLEETIPEETANEIGVKYEEEAEQVKPASVENTEEVKIEEDIVRDDDGYVHQKQVEIPTIVINENSSAVAEDLSEKKDNADEITNEVEVKLHEEESDELQKQEASVDATEESEENEVQEYVSTEEPENNQFNEKLEESRDIQTVNDHQEIAEEVTEISPENSDESVHVEEIAPVMRRRDDYVSPQEKESEVPSRTDVDSSCLKKFIVDTNEFLNHEQATS